MVPQNGSYICQKRRPLNLACCFLCLTRWAAVPAVAYKAASYTECGCAGQGESAFQSKAKPELPNNTYMYNGGALSQYTVKTHM